jgi:F-type H+-transporting ATPase subunit a
MRILVIIVLIALASTTSFLFAAHAKGGSDFETLYLHLLPAPLLKDNHAAASYDNYLLAFDVPESMAALATNAHAVHEGTETPVWAVTNLQLFQVTSVLVLLIAFAGVPRYLKTGQGDRLSRIFAGFATWIRDEMVYPTMGKETGRKFLPYFLYVFFFILFMNLLGLVPAAATATASIFVTGALALTTLLAMLVCGMVAQGPLKFWLNLVPHVPWPLWPLMFVVEVFGLFMKPFALMIRLFANMNGGHMVVLSVIGLIFLAGGFGVIPGSTVAPVALGFAVFIMLIEFFVAMVQAYVFTQLSIIFVGMAVHPEH